jgi:hypothetical protein
MTDKVIVTVVVTDETYEYKTTLDNANAVQISIALGQLELARIGLLRELARLTQKGEVKT